MARSYGFNGNYSLVASATLPVFGLSNVGATVRPKIYDIIMGSDAVADNAAKFIIQRSTTKGTPAGDFVPISLDPGDPAALTVTSYALYAAGPTLTASAYVLQWAQNQRATFRWVAAPSKEIVFPSTILYGVACMSTVVTAGYNAVWSVEFEE